MNPINHTIPTPAATSRVDDEGKIDFRSGTVLMQVPVVVTDKSGRHLQHLSKDKFQVFENGKEQTISTFEEIVADNSSQVAFQPSPGIYRNLAIDTQHPRSVLVIAIDTVNTPFLDQANPVTAWSVNPTTIATIDANGVAECLPGQVGTVKIEIAIAGDGPLMNVAQLTCP